MKRKLFMVTALVLLVLASGFAEGTTWSNPDDVPFSADATSLGSLTIPRSMLSAVSNGIYYDEIDTVILSPAELSNYSGYSIITGYGNYEYDYEGGTDYNNNWLFPFRTTATLDQADELGNFLLGATGEFFGFRGGVITSFTLNTTERLDADGNGTADSSVYENTDTETVDADTDGITDYVYSEVDNFTDYSNVNTFHFGAGVDVEVLGVSLYASVENTYNHLGGTYDFTRGLNADTDSTADPLDVVTSEGVIVGWQEEGAVRNNPMVTSSEWLFGARAHLPLEVADFSMPVKADFYVGSDTPTPAYQEKLTYSIATTNVTGASDATYVSSAEAVFGYVAIDGSTDLTAFGGNTGAYDFDDATDYDGLITTVQAADYAYDPSESSVFNFKTGVKALIDPEIVVSDVFSLRTRGQVGYELDMTNQKNTGVKSLTYNRVVPGQTQNAVYSYTSTDTATTGTTVNTLDFELGGLMDLHNRDNTLGVACGLFYDPELKFTGSTVKDDTRVTTTSYIDPNNVTPDATVYADTVGIGSAQGTETTTTYAATYADGKSSSSTQLTNQFYIPASVRIATPSDKISLTLGYLLKHDNSMTTTKTYDATPAAPALRTLANAAGTNIADPAAATTDNTNSVIEGSTTTLSSSGVWEGESNFMIRWKPMDGLFVDFYGTTVSSALDFTLFGDDGSGTGFNPAAFIDQLGISFTISAK